jgi:hypothetical protein
MTPSASLKLQISDSRNATSSRAARTEPGHCKNRQHDEKCEEHAVDDDKGRMELSRWQRLQARHMLERLHDQHEKIEILGQHRADDIGLAPRTSQATDVAGEDRHRQYRQRKNADAMRRSKGMQRKEDESRRARGHGGAEENRGPTGERFPLDQPEQGGKSRADSEQADQDMRERERGQVKEGVDHNRHGISSRKPGFLPSQI